MSNLQKVLAIDGPCGSGKSSIALMVSSRLKALHVDTGSLYRGISYFLDSKKIDFNDEKKVDSTLKEISIEYGKSNDELIIINDLNLTQLIREHRVSHLASEVSKIPIVREFLLGIQRQIVDKRFCVMEGRDIGTVVFPKAFCKVYLTASVDVRAQRRFDQLEQLGNASKMSLEQVLEDVRQRDQKDMRRELAPLKQAEDAFLIDSSELNEEQVIDRICDMVQQKAQEYGINIQS